MATEVRKRVDDVGRELERSAIQRESEVDDEEHEHGAYGGEADRKSVREDDRDLLEGAEAEAGEAGETGTGVRREQQDLLGDLDGTMDTGRASTDVVEENGLVEFER